MIGATKLSEPGAMHPAMITMHSPSASRGSPDPRNGRSAGIRLSLAIACSSLGAPVIDWRPAPKVRARCRRGRCTRAATTPPPRAAPSSSPRGRRGGDGAVHEGGEQVEERGDEHGGDRAARDRRLRVAQVARAVRPRHDPGDRREEEGEGEAEVARGVALAVLDQRFGRPVVGADVRAAHPGDLLHELEQRRRDVARAAGVVVVGGVRRGGALERGVGDGVGTAAALGGGEARVLLLGHADVT